MKKALVWCNKRAGKDFCLLFSIFSSLCCIALAFSACFELLHSFRFGRIGSTLGYFAFAAIALFLYKAAHAGGEEDDETEVPPQ